MNVDEHLLTCLIEECAEIQKRATKALRFGIDDRDPTRVNASSERARLREEIIDFLGVVEMLEDRDVLSATFFVPDHLRSAIDAKKKKVREFFDYAREKGTLA